MELYFYVDTKGGYRSNYDIKGGWLNGAFEEVYKGLRQGKIN